jgi:regulator of replication initiation timing
MNIDDYLKIFNEASNGLPSDIDPALKADVNNIAQKLKAKIEENRTAALEGKDLVHTAENTRAEMDYLTSQFKDKYGTKGNK